MKKKISFVGFFVFLVGLFLFLVLQLSPLGMNRTSQRFIVLKGSTASQIAYDLEKQGLIRNHLVFRLYAKLTGASTRIRAGEYDLNSTQSIPEIVTQFLKGPTEVWVTIPEGFRREEVAQKLVSDMGLTQARASTFSQDFLDKTANKEGYLFPDTYLVPLSVDVDTVVSVMENNFEKKYADAQKTQTVRLTKQQAVILASIVQREAISPEDMRGVASVLENRLAIGMPLGSDVTLEYALGYQPLEKTWWKKDLTANDLTFKSLYNTRINAGFPPTPISNPGLVALQAALNPPQSDYLYYLSDSSGKLHFAKTLDEHNANIQKYLQ